MKNVGQPLLLQGFIAILDVIQILCTKQSLSNISIFYFEFAINLKLPPLHFKENTFFFFRTTLFVVNFVGYPFHTIVILQKI